MPEILAVLDTSGWEPLRKILPYVVVVQKFGDERDKVYRKVIDKVMEFLCKKNINDCNVEPKLYYAQFDSETMVETKALVEPVADVEDLEMINVEVENTSFKSVLSVLDKRLSRKAYLVSEIGFLSPVVLFLVNDVASQEDMLEEIGKNKWFMYARKTALVFDNSSEKTLAGIVGSYENIFKLTDDFDEAELEALFENLFVRQEIPATGGICADYHKNRMSQGIEIKVDELVTVDPIDGGWYGEDDWE